MAIIAPDIGIDLGTSNTLVHVRRKGIVINEPTILVVDSTGKHAVKAIGEDVYAPTVCTNGKTYQLVKHVGIVPFITVYYARRCWGTYSYNILDIPIDTISQAMAHKNGLRVTNFYVKRSNEKVDKANRAMIDKLKADLEEYKRENNIA